MSVIRVVRDEQKVSKCFIVFPHDLGVRANISAVRTKAKKAYFADLEVVKTVCAMHCVPIACGALV